MVSVAIGPHLIHDESHICHVPRRDPPHLMQKMGDCYGLQPRNDVYQIFRMACLVAMTCLVVLCLMQGFALYKVDF